MLDVAYDGVVFAAPINDQDWHVAWYPPPDPPSGTPHGAAALCLADGQVVLVSSDGENWDLPGGRPEANETLLDTLQREILEEACASVTSCTLLGFTRGACIRGHEQGWVLVRSIWRAEVALDVWRPQFEIAHRRLVPVGEALAELFGQPHFPHELRPPYRRIFAEAGLPSRLDLDQSNVLWFKPNSVVPDFRSRLFSRVTEWSCYVARRTMSANNNARESHVGIDAVRWAPRVNPSLIRRLYESDARGLLGEDLLSKVGFALWARCQSILEAYQAHEDGRIVCPGCGELIVRQSRAWEEKDALLVCRGCGWSTRWGDYQKTYQHKHLHGGGAIAFYGEFIEQFGRASSAPEKMLAIDRLIHRFHWELVHIPGRSAARELIYAKNNVELLTFLDSLSYDEPSTPGLEDGKANWDRNLGESGWHRMTGFGLARREEPLEPCLLSPELDDQGRCRGAKRTCAPKTATP